MLPTETAVFDILRENAELNILPLYKSMQTHQIREKGPGNLVTDADEASEEFLSDKLSDMIQGSLVVGEEAVFKDKKLLNALNTDSPVWIIDPIDGTYNFTHGRSKWGVLLSLAYKGDIVFGVMYDVLNNHFIFAKQGEGTYLRDENGKDQKLDLKSPPKPTTKYCGHVGGAQAWHFKKLNPFCGEINNIRCSMHDFWALLTGKIDFTFHTSTTPWDHSAPSIVVKEAGGYVAAGAEGQEYNVCQKQRYLLATYNQNDWKELADNFHSVLKK